MTQPAISHFVGGMLERKDEEQEWGMNRVWGNQVTSAAVSEVREMIRLMRTFNSQLLLFGDPSSKSSSAAAAKLFDESAVPVLSWRVSRVSIKILS
jgi:hypothetical protein